MNASSNNSVDEIVALSAPKPFRPSVRRGPFTTHNGPWFHWAEELDWRQGVRLLERHCNSRGIVHGGFLSSFGDGLAATAVFREINRASVTIKLNTEFLRSAKEGSGCRVQRKSIMRPKTLLLSMPMHGRARSAISLRRIWFSEAPQYFV